MKKTEDNKSQPQLIPVYLDGKLLVEETFQDVVKRLGSDRDVTLALLRGNGKVNLFTPGNQEGIVMRDGFLHHDFSFIMSGMPSVKHKSIINENETK